MPESRSQADSAMSVARVRQLVQKLKADELRQPLSTLRDLRQEEQGQEIANPELLEYKKQEDAV